MQSTAELKKKKPELEGMVPVKLEMPPVKGGERPAPFVVKLQEVRIEGKVPPERRKPTLLPEVRVEGKVPVERREPTRLAEVRIEGKVPPERREPTRLPEVRIEGKVPEEQSEAPKKKKPGV